MTSEMIVAKKAMVSELAKAIIKSWLLKSFSVIIEREAAPDDVALGVVEAEGDQRDERRIKEEEHAEQPKAHLPGAIIFKGRAPQGHG